MYDTDAERGRNNETYNVVFLYRKMCKQEEKEEEGRCEEGKDGMCVGIESL